MVAKGQQKTNSKIEDMILLEPSQLLDTSYIDWFKYHFLGYLVKENIEVCYVGIPYSNHHGLSERNAL